MVSAGRIGMFLGLLAGCSVQAPSSDASMGVDSTQPATSVAGVSGGVSGRTGSAGSGVAPTKTVAATSGTAAGASGALGSQSSSTGTLSGAAKAGSGAPMTVAGASGSSGNAGAAGGGMKEGGAAGAGMMSTVSESGCQVAPITSDLRGRYENMDDDYYTKFASANGVIIGTGPDVADEALTRYCRLLTEMVSNEKVRKAILDDKMWFTMIDEKEQLSDLPQIARDYGTSLNQRARGLGGLTPTICAEDSIMCLPGDRWNGDCICPHETGHTLYSSGIAKVSDLSKRLTTITQDARSSGRLANAYVWMDGNESGMMAWGVQVWYDCAINGTNGAYHSDINTRAELQKEMPDFYQFLSELLPAENQYKDCYAK